MNAINATRMLGLLAGVTLSAGAYAHEHEVLRGRLVFTDHEKAVVNVLDLDSGAVSHTIEVTKADPALIPTEGGRFIVIRTSDDAGTVRILDTGLIYESHDDHFDIEKGEVKLLDAVFAGSKPSHVVSENGEIAVFYDGQRPSLGASDHKVVTVPLTSLEVPATASIRKTPAPQHGIAVPLGNDEFLISVAKEAYASGSDPKASARPNGFEILNRALGWKLLVDLNNAKDPDRSCKEFHGHASLKNTHVFACHMKVEGDARSDGGVLVVSKAKSGEWQSHKLAYPDDRRSSTIKSGGAGTYLVGNYGGADGQPFDTMIRIDPTTKSLTEADTFKVSDGQAVCQFEVSSDGRRVVNLTADGKLRVYDIAPEWKTVAIFDAVSAFDCAWDAKTPSPSLALIGNNAFVSDPENGRIREFQLNSLRQGLDIQVGGKPSNIANGGFRH